MDNISGNDQTQHHPPGQHRAEPLTDESPQTAEQEAELGEEKIEEELDPEAVVDELPDVSAEEDQEAVEEHDDDLRDTISPDRDSMNQFLPGARII